MVSCKGQRLRKGKPNIMNKNYVVMLCGLFIALQVVLGRFLAIDLAFLRISFIFVPIALGGAIFGPLWNGLICVAADIVGFLLVPGQGAFFPGFTLSAFLTGFAYGFFLKVSVPAADTSTSRRAAVAARIRQVLNEIARPSPSTTLSGGRALLLRTLLAAFCVTILIDALLNTFWVSILFHKAYIYYFGTRFLKSLAMLPVHVAVFGVLWRSLGKYVESVVFPKITAT